jgi:hypothetical protein
MIPFFTRFFSSDTAFERMLRAFLLAWGSAEMTGGAIEWPHLVLGAAGLLPAGEANPKKD